MRITLLLAGSILSVAALGQSPDPSPTIATMMDREIGAIEKQILDAAEAMPESKYNFSPESLKIPGSDYSGVGTFGVEVKHIAASNYALWPPLTGDRRGAANRPAFTWPHSRWPMLSITMGRGWSTCG